MTGADAANQMGGLHRPGRLASACRLANAAASRPRAIPATDAAV